MIDVTVSKVYETTNIKFTVKLTKITVFGVSLGQSTHFHAQRSLLG